MVISREGGEVMLASCKELCELYKLQILRDGKVYLHVTSSKDKGGKTLLGGIKLPKSLKILNGNFSSEVLEWFLKGLNTKASYVKVNKEHTKCEVLLVMNDGREFSKSFGLR